MYHFAGLRTDVSTPKQDIEWLIRRVERLESIARQVRAYVEDPTAGRMDASWNVYKEAISALAEEERVMSVDEIKAKYDWDKPLADNEIRYLIAKVERLEHFRSEVRRKWVNAIGDSMVDLLGLDKGLDEEDCGY